MDRIDQIERELNYIKGRVRVLEQQLEEEKKKAREPAAGSGGAFGTSAGARRAKTAPLAGPGRGVSAERKTPSAQAVPGAAIMSENAAVPGSSVTESGTAAGNAMTQKTFAAAQKNAAETGNAVMTGNAAVPETTAVSGIFGSTPEIAAEPGTTAVLEHVAESGASAVAAGGMTAPESSAESLKTTAASGPTAAQENMAVSGTFGPTPETAAEPGPTAASENMAASGPFAAAPETAPVPEIPAAPEAGAGTGPKRPGASVCRRPLTESMVGKYALPVAAAILIVFGIGVLSLMMWNFVPDAGKAGLVGMMGAVCFVIGAIFGRNEKMRLFKHSMTSVALVILYSDVIAMNFAWKLIPEMVTLFLIILWCGFAALASLRYREKLFYYVLEAGICAAAVCTMGLIVLDGRGVILFAITFILFIVSCLGYWLQYRSGNNVFGLAAIFLFIVQAAAMNSARFQNDWPYHFNRAYFAMECVMFATMILLVCLYEELLFEKDNKRQNERALVMSCAVTAVLPFVTYAADASAVINLIFCALILRKKRWRTVLSVPAYIHLAVAAMVLAGKWDMAINGLTVLAALLFLLDQLLGEKVFRIQCWITEIAAVCLWVLLYSTFFSKGIVDLIRFGFPLLLTGAAMMVCAMVRKQYWSVKILLSAFAVSLYWMGVQLGIQVDWLPSAVWMLSALGLAYICLIVSSVWMDRKAGKIQLFTLIWAWILETELFSEGIFREGAGEITVIGFLLLIHTVYWGYLLQIRRKGKMGKDAAFALLCSFHILLLAEKTPLGDISILISLLMMAVAAVLIICGFLLRRKGFRLYGLIFIIFSVVKMILFDIAGSGSIIRVAALIAGGVICLAISYVYNRLEKKLEDS